jgi:hypothetical protein
MSFYDDNELIAFPLVGIDNNLIPHDIIVDCVVHGPSSLGTTLALRSISVTDLLVSCVLTIGGTDAAFVTVPLDTLQIHSPIQIEAIQDGVSGFIAFGGGVERASLRVDGDYQFLPESLISYQFDAITPTLAIGAHSLHGLVSLDVGTGLTISAANMRVRNEDTTITTTTVGLISVQDPGIFSDPIPGCLRPAEGNPLVSPITSINSVEPDCSGALTLQIVSVLQLPTDPEVTTVAVPMGLSLRDSGVPCST